MSEPTVAVVRDQDGAVRYAARGSAFVQNGLADGSLTDVEAVREDPSNAAAGDSANAKSARRQSGNRAGGQSGADSN